jgi:hypothetical protein
MGRPSTLRAAIASYRSDVGDVSWVVPYTRIEFPAQPVGIPFHHWSAGVCAATSIAHKGIAVGVKAIVTTALEVMTQPQLLTRIKQSFRRGLARTQYTPLLPTEVSPRIVRSWKHIVQQWRHTIMTRPRPHRTRRCFHARASLPLR